MKPSQELVRQLPDATYLALGLPRLDNIAQIADQARRTDEQIKETIREAVEYIPPFAREIAEILHPAVIILKQARDELNADTSSPKANLVEDKVDEIADRQLWKLRSSPDQIGHARAIGKKLVGRLHTDRSDTLFTTGLSQGEQTTALQKVKKAAERDDLDQAQDVYLQTGSRSVVAIITEMLKEGKSFKEITQEHPQLATEMRVLEEVAYIRLFEHNPFGTRIQPRKAKAIQTVREAERKAFEMKWEDDRQARIIGYIAIHGSFTDFVEVTAQLNPNQVASLQKIEEAIRRAGGWVGGVDEYLKKTVPRAEIPGPQGAEQKAIAELARKVVCAIQTSLVGSSEDEKEAALREMLEAVMWVDRSARGYADDLQYQANRARNPSSEKINKKIDEHIIFNIKKENKY